MPIQIPTPLQELHAAPLLRKNIRLWIKRDDLIHPIIQGNKWRKLKYNIQEAQRTQKKYLVTFGGAYSNHIHATAAAGEYFGIKTIGIIRGEEVQPLNPTLSYAHQCRMQLHFVDRKTYRLKEKLLPQLDFFSASQIDLQKECYIIPEGGTNSFAIKGCQELAKEIENQMEIPPDFVALSCGTGGTIVGVISGLNNTSHVLGFSALKGDFLKEEIKILLTDIEIPSSTNNWSLQTDYHFGGYAKFDKNLIDFINTFKRDFNIPLDPIYTGKMMYGIFNLIQKGFFKRGSRIVVIHTGGLQGITGFNQQFNFPIQ